MFDSALVPDWCGFKTETLPCARAFLLKLSPVAPFSGAGSVSTAFLAFGFPVSRVPIRVSGGARFAECTILPAGRPAGRPRTGLPWAQRKFGVLLPVALPLAVPAVAVAVLLAVAAAPLRHGEKDKPDGRERPCAYTATKACGENGEDGNAYGKDM